MPSSEQFEEILTTHLNEMYALAFQLTGTRHNAEDLVQDLFINLSMRQYQKREIERPKAWLATILYRTFVDQWRRQKRSPLVYGADENSAHASSSIDISGVFSCQPEHEYERGQKRERALEILQQLNLRQREIVILHDLHEYTMTEIAVIMDLPLGTIKSNLHRARKNIATLLDEMHHESQRLEEKNHSNVGQQASQLMDKPHIQASPPDLESLQEILS